MSQTTRICNHAHTTAASSEIVMAFCPACRCFWLNQSPRLQPASLQQRLRIPRQQSHSYWHHFPTERQA